MYFWLLHEKYFLLVYDIFWISFFFAILGKQEKNLKKIQEVLDIYLWIGYNKQVFVRHDGHSPSGKALDSDSSIRRFESFVPSEGCITEVSSAVRLFLCEIGGAVKTQPLWYIRQASVCAERNRQGLKRKEQRSMQSDLNSRQPYIRRGRQDRTPRWNERSFPWRQRS